MSAVLRLRHLLWMVLMVPPDLTYIRFCEFGPSVSSPPVREVMADQTVAVAHSTMRGREDINNSVKGRKQSQVLDRRPGSKRQMWTEASLPQVNEQGPLLVCIGITSNGLMGRKPYIWLKTWWRWDISLMITLWLLRGKRGNTSQS